MIQARQGLRQQAVQGGVLPFLVSEAVEQLDHVGGVADAHQVLAQRQVRVDRLGLGDDQRVTAARQQQADPGEGLQVTGLARVRLARSLGDGAHLAQLTREQPEHPVGFAPIGVTQDDGFYTQGTLAVWHGGNYMREGVRRKPPTTKPTTTKDAKDRKVHKGNLLGYEGHKRVGFYAGAAYG